MKKAYPATAGGRQAFMDSHSLLGLVLALDTTEFKGDPGADVLGHQATVRALQQMLARMVQSISQPAESRGALSTQDMQNALGRFRGGRRQHDAEEFLTFLLAALMDPDLCTSFALHNQLTKLVEVRWKTETSCQVCWSEKDGGGYSCNMVRVCLDPCGGEGKQLGGLVRTGLQWWRADDRRQSVPV